MDLGMIGLGRMGGMMTERLLQSGHAVVGFDRSPEAVDRVKNLGACGGDSIGSRMQATRASPRGLAHGAVRRCSRSHNRGASAAPEPGDVIIDGGNSNFKDTIRRAAMLKARGFAMVDCGTSGGIWGLAGGYSLMVGGDPETVEWLRPIFEAPAPAPDRGWGHVGGNGAGHLVKMVHNGIEYGMMQAYAEGFAILRAKEEYHLDLAQIGEIWRNGSVVRSWLLDLLTQAITDNPEMKGIAPRSPTPERGAGRSSKRSSATSPAPVITLSLIERIRSRDRDSYSDRLLAAMRRAVRRTSGQIGARA